MNSESEYFQAHVVQKRMPRAGLEPARRITKEEFLISLGIYRVQ